MALAKVQLNRDWKNHKAGDVIETNWTSALSLIDDGSATLIKEKGKKAVRKPGRNKMVTARKTRRK